MPAQRPRASFEPISPALDLKALVESTENFTYVDRIKCEMIEVQGMEAFERLVTQHVILAGKPLVIEGYDQLLDPWTFTPKWLRDNCGEKVENATNLTTKDNLPLTMGHYLRNMGRLTNQFFDRADAYKEKQRQRVYLKDIDCPPVWWDKLKTHIPSILVYLNESTGNVAGFGAVPETNVAGNRLGRGIARAGDLMSSLPQDMRAENLMCYIGHEGTYTPAHREMCASLGHNIMVEASSTVSDDGKTEKPGSSVWFMTESNDRHVVSEYWLSVLGHDIEVEHHFAQIVAWKKAPFKVYIVEQCPGDLILIPPLAPHQVWNRGSRTMKVAWNRTTIETLEMALNEALPRSRVVCRDEQYKNKAIIYYTLQKYASLLALAQQQASQLPNDTGHQMMYGKQSKVKQLIKDFKRLFALYRQILLSEMFNPEDRDPKSIEYLPFDSNVTCAYCRCNIFNRFLTCPSCKDVLGHNTEDGDPYDVCLDCYAMGRSCECISGQKWVEQFKWKELTSKYEAWRSLIITLDGGQITLKTPLPLQQEQKRYGKKTLAEVCKEQLKRRPWRDVRKANEPEPDESDEEIVVGDNGMVQKVVKKKSKAWQRDNHACHVCCKQHPKWKMANCTTCDKWWCFGTLFRGWDKMPIEIMEQTQWRCPHCLGICFAGNCRRDPKMKPYEPKGTLLGHDTRKVADARSTEALVDFSVSNLNWLKDDDVPNRMESGRFKRAKAEAQKSKTGMGDDDEEEEDEDDAASEPQVEYTLTEENTPIDPALNGGNDVVLPRLTRHTSDANRSSTGGGLDDEGDTAFARRLQEANSALPPPAAMVAGMSAYAAPDGYAPLTTAGYVAPTAHMYPQPDEDSSYLYPSNDRGSEGTERESDQLRPFKRRRKDQEQIDENEDITMSKHPRAKKPRLTAAGFRSWDLAEDAVPAGQSGGKAKSEAQRQFEREKERKALEKAKVDGRFIMLQAAIRGKKRVVKLKVPSARLAQLQAQHTARAALGTTNGISVGADPNQSTEQRSDSEDHDEVLLKSDVAPKKTKDDLREERREKERTGIIVTGGAKKALIPVEKDDNYSYRSRERHPNNKKPGQAKAPDDRASRPKRATRNQTFDYEEVDIGSDDDSRLVQAQSGPASGSGRARDRRSLPGYLRNRNVQNGVPVDESGPNQNSHPPSVSSATPKKTAHKPTAGKRPSMRPIQSLPGASASRNVGIEDYYETDSRVLTNRQRDESSTPQSGSAPSLPTTTRVDEENRLAKLHALQMVESNHGTPHPDNNGDERNSRPQFVSMADIQAISSEESSDDDSIDAVPARRAPYRTQG